MNDCIRFTKYAKGDHFGALAGRLIPLTWLVAVHRDGAFVWTDEERSVYTMMIYLVRIVKYFGAHFRKNDARQYAGGETVFHYRETDTTARVQGVRGKALVFKHQLWHEVTFLRTKRIFVFDLHSVGQTIAARREVYSPNRFDVCASGKQPLRACTSLIF